MREYIFILNTKDNLKIVCLFRAEPVNMIKHPGRCCRVELNKAFSLNNECQYWENIIGKPETIYFLKDSFETPSFLSLVLSPSGST